MEGFLLKKGDVVIKNNDIAIIGGKELTMQTIACLLKTNLGEWYLNEDEGINTFCMLAKNPNYDEIKDNVLLALHQIDESFVLLSFDADVDDERNLTLSFRAENDDGETVEMTI